MVPWPASKAIQINIPKIVFVANIFPPQYSKNKRQILVLCFMYAGKMYAGQNVQIGKCHLYKNIILGSETGIGNTNSKLNSSGFKFRSSNTIISTDRDLFILTKSREKWIGPYHNLQTVINKIKSKFQIFIFFIDIYNMIIFYYLL